MAEVSEVCFPRGGLPLLSKKNYNKASKKSSKKLKVSIKFCFAILLDYKVIYQ